MIKTLLKFRNPDATLDLNTQFSEFFKKGLVSGGALQTVFPNSQPQVTVSPFKLIGQDGMVVIETSEITTFTLPTNQTSLIVFRSEYVPNDEPIYGFETLEISAYNALSPNDKQKRVIFGAITTAGLSDEPTINLDLRDVIDPVGRNILRGKVETAAQLPATNNRIGDAYLVESGVPDTNNGLYIWKGVSGWVNITDALSLSSIIQQHRSNLFANEVHLTNSQADAALGSFGAPSDSNRYVTSQDPRVPTQDENDALVGYSQTQPEETPSAGNPYITAAYSLAEPMSIQINGIGGLIHLPLAQGPIFVGLGGTGTANQYFGIYDATEEREYVNSLGEPVKITGVFKDIAGTTPLNPSSETTVINSNGFWSESLYLGYSGSIDPSDTISLRYGRKFKFPNLNRGMAIKPGPRSAVTGEVLKRLSDISGRLFDDPIQTGETNVELRQSQLSTRRYLNTTTSSDMIVPGTAFPRLREISDIAADFPLLTGEIVEFNTLANYEVRWSALDVAAFDLTHTEDMPVVAVIKYAVGTTLPAISPGWTFIDDIGQEFRILAYNGTDSILIYTGGSPVNTANANGNQSKILRNNNPRKLELLADHQTSMYREFFPIEGLVAAKDEFEALPPGGVQVGSYTPADNFSMIGTSVLPNQGRSGGAPRGRPLYYVSPKNTGLRNETRLLLIGNWTTLDDHPRQVLGNLSQGTAAVSYTGRLNSITLYTQVRSGMPFGFRVFVDGAYNHTASQFLTNAEAQPGLTPSDVIKNLRGDNEKTMMPLYFSDLGITDSNIHTVQIEITQVGVSNPDEDFPLYGVEVFYNGSLEAQGRSFTQTDFISIGSEASVSNPITSAIRGSKVVRYIDRSTKTRQTATHSLPGVFSTAVNMLSTETQVSDASLAQQCNVGDILLFTNRSTTVSDAINFVYRRVTAVNRANGTVTINQTLGFNLSSPSRVELVCRVPSAPTGTPALGAPKDLSSTEYARFMVSDWSVGLSRDVAALSTASADSRVTVLDDGSTSLLVKDCRRVSTGLEGVKEAIRLETAGAYMVVTGWGTRMDVLFCGAGGTSSTVDIEIDGLHTYSITVPNDGQVRHSLFFSGNPQTHTVKISNASVPATVSIGQWIFHTVASPVVQGTGVSEFEIPRNATAANSNFFDFAPTSVTNPLLVSPSGLRLVDITKMAARFYEGTTGTLDWEVTQDFQINPVFGYYLKTDRTTAIMDVKLVGRHVELYFMAGPNHGIVQLFVNGLVASSSNFPKTFGPGYDSSTGRVDLYSATPKMIRIVLTDLTMKEQFIRVQNTGTKNPLSSANNLTVFMVAENPGTFALQRRNNEDKQINRLHVDSFRDLRQFLSLTTEQVGLITTSQDDEVVEEDVQLGYLNSCFAMSDGSGVAQNCTVSVVGGVTVVDVGFSFTPAVTPSFTTGDLDVYVDGMLIPRRVVGTTQDSWYEEDLIQGGRLKMWANLSGAPLSIEIRKRGGTVDVSQTNTGRLAVGLGIIVGSTSQVEQGIANYDNLTNAITEALEGSKITVLSGVNTTETILLDKRLTIEGQGYDSRINGTFTFLSTADFATVRGLYVNQLIFQSGAVGIQAVDCFWDTNPIDPNTAGSNRVTGMSTV